MTTAHDEYLESKILTATPYQLHMMVIDGAVRHAAAAEQALAAADFEKAHLALGDARRFVGELISGLDPTQLPDVVDNLKAMFLFVYRSLIEADVHRKQRVVSDALTILRMHRETWLALGERLKTESATGALTPVAEPAATGSRFSWDS